MKSARRLLLALLVAPALALAAGDGVRLDRAPIKEDDLISLQNGSHTYINYCLGCHGASYMRYNRLADLGLTEQQIRNYLILTDAKVGDLMKTAMDSKDSREWFGAPPPDLSVIARSRSSQAGSGADWVYTYLRGFYRDPGRPTGWNNLVFENVGMPHVLWQLNGQQALVVRQFETHDAANAARLQSKTVARIDQVTEKDKNGKEVKRYLLKTLQTERAGSMSSLEYDRMIADLVNFLVYMGEPVKRLRVELGIYVLMFLGILFVLAYALKKEYWKDVH
jgi:ubiquinol-cytochrome c reductase cytochrome c1 subunit